MGKRYLTEKEEGRIRRAIKQKIQFFSPTISPAPKDMTRREIESIRSAIMIYHEAGMKGVVIQPKYMGSYCDIYLHRDLDKTKFYSRRGYEVRLDFEILIQAVKYLHNKFFCDECEINFKDAELIIIQSELMPWHALGGGLIERDFGGYEISHRIHQRYFASTGIKKDVESLTEDPIYRQFLEDKCVMDRKTLLKKYPMHIASQYEALEALAFPDVEQYLQDIEVYSEQLSLYGSAGELHFKPFNILKIVYCDGREVIPGDHKFGFLSVRLNQEENPMFEIDFSTPELDKQIDLAYKFFNTLTDDKKMEGVIIKPIGIWNPDVAPMFKVRNNNYLQMIYGVNFQREYDYYLNKRSIGGKVRASKNQWNIAQEIIKIPMTEISDDNVNYTKLIRGRIYEEDYERLLDSRL